MVVEWPIQVASSLRLPERIAAKNSSCSRSYMLFGVRGLRQAQFFSPMISAELVPNFAMPLVP